MMIYYVVLGIGILAGIAGQMLLKAGADAPTLVEQILRPSTLIGLALYGSAAFLYIFALRKIPVSVAFPSVSLSYAIVAVLGHFLFGEPFGIKQIGGIVLIMDLQPHEVAMFREKLNHHWMGFAEPQLHTWLTTAGFENARWHPLSPTKGRAKEAATQIPDLFALRAEVV